MLEVLRNRSYPKLFSAQVIALLGTGLLNVAWGFWLLAWPATKLAGCSAWP